MTRSRASTGILLQPATLVLPSAERRAKWLAQAVAGFVAPGSANKLYYKLILERLWPEGHGLPGPHVTQDELREAINAGRPAGSPPYLDVFRRVRELQGEEGFTAIVKSGVRYQLQSTETSAKREPRAKPKGTLWAQIKADADYRCAKCKRQEPEVKLEPDHRVPRSRNGTNDDDNWQPLCKQCNNLKSSACSGCDLQCMVCFWAFPEQFAEIIVNDSNRQLIRQAAEKEQISQSEIANRILRRHFNSS
ncbi:HNH endonuclease [Sphingomonas sp. HMWF008]|nr:HNH endonuclease [Sphingomonas sp. HMWF008]